MLPPLDQLSAALLALHVYLNDVFADPAFLEEFNAWSAVWKILAVFGCAGAFLFGQRERRQRT